jgi:ATP synthase protein I
MSDERGRFDPPTEGEERDRKAASAAAKYGGLGLQFALSIILFLYAGRWLDRRLGTEPWFLILGVFTGAGAAFYSMYRTLMADLRREEEERRARKGTPGSVP